MTNGEPSLDISDNIIESTEVQARIDWLQEQLDQDDIDLDRAYRGVTNPNVEDWSRDDMPGVFSEDERNDMEEEVAQLLEFKASATIFSTDDWDAGQTYISDDHFEEYAQEYAADLHGAELENAAWPFGHIDWAEAADALKSDYTEVDGLDTTWWCR